MRYSFLSPHQFNSLAEFIDTWLITSHSPWPLDIAAPNTASQLIVRRLVDAVKERFMGRTAELDIGATVPLVGLETSTLSNLLQEFQHPGRFAVLFVDHVLIQEAFTWRDEHHIHWLAIDWWQWFRRRIPENRLSDAWMYLCLTNPFYRSSYEFLSTGLSAELAQSMAEHGETLVRQFSDFTAEQILAVWQSANEMD